MAVPLPPPVGAPIDPVVAARMATALMSTHAMWKGKHLISNSLCPGSDETIVAQMTEFLFSALAPR